MPRKYAPSKGGKPTSALFLPGVGYLSSREKKSLNDLLRKVKAPPEEIAHNPDLAAMLAEHLTAKVKRQRQARRFFGF
jgi:hypothetical protein